MWVVYVLQHSNTQELYIGFTNDLERRMKEHNSGRQKSTQRKSGEWLLIYAEAYRLKQDASEREHKLKHHGSAKQKLKLRIKHSLLES